MQTLYLLGPLNEFVGSREFEPGGGFPSRATMTPVPSVPLEEGHQWVFEGDWVQRPLPIVDPVKLREAIAGGKWAAVAAKRVETMNAGFVYSFPSNVASAGGMGTIQTRDQLLYPDIGNLQTIGLRALMKQAVGITAPAHGLRVYENTIFILTPAQAIACIDAVIQYGEDQYQVKWGHDAAIQALLDAEDDAGLRNYNFNTGWGQGL